MDIETRFWSKVDTSGDCWVWTAGRWSSRPGLDYGQFWMNGRMEKAYRASGQTENAETARKAAEALEAKVKDLEK